MKSVKTTTGQRLWRPCRNCVACQITRQYAWANRLLYEMVRAGLDRCLFFGHTYAPEHLPISEHIPAGKLSETQQKLKLKIVEKFDKNAKRLRSDTPGGALMTEKEKTFLQELLEQMHGDNPAKPTISRRDYTLWRKRLRERLGRLPKILGVGEYGENTGRPHCHSVIIDISAEEARVADECWPHGTMDYSFVRSGKVGAYIAKDIVKSTWSKNRYIAQNREAPFMSWPQGKGRSLAAGQEKEIYEALSKMQAIMPAEQFEHLLQSEHVGRSYTVRTPKKSAGGDDRGSTKTQVRYGRTAYTRAIEKLDRNPIASEFAAKRAAQVAHLDVEFADPTSRFFDEEHLEHHEAKKAKALAKLEKAQRRHASILERKHRAHRARV